MSAATSQRTVRRLPERQQDDRVSLCTVRELPAAYADHAGGQAAEPLLLCVERASDDLADMVHPVADGVAVDEHRVRNLPDAAVILQVVFECPDIFESWAAS